MNLDDMKASVERYFNNTSKEQLLKDLKETNCLQFLEDIKNEEDQNNYSSSKYVTPDGVPADNVIFTITFEQEVPNTMPKTSLKVLMIRRKKWPYAGCWALPGGFSNEHENLLDAAKRELKEETGIDNLPISHFGVYSGLDEQNNIRDPRGWIISSAYFALVNEKHLEHRKAADDAADERLFDIEELFSMQKGNENGDFDSNENKMAFDHNVIIKDAFNQIQKQMLESDIAKEFLPEEFTISELFEVVATVFPKLKEIYPKEQMGNFKRKVLTRGLIEKVNKESNRNSRRAAQLYKFSDSIQTLSHYI